jgi:hypothetical protein
MAFHSPAGHRIPKMKVLIWREHSGDPLSKVIEAITRGSYTHAALLVHGASLSIVEAYWPELRTRALTEAELPGLDVFAVEGLTPEIEQKLIDWWAEKIQQHVAYSLKGLARFSPVLRLLFGEGSDADTHKEMFCSQAVAQGFEDCGLPLLHEHSWCVDPERLSGSPLLTKLGDGTILLKK